MCTRVFSFVRLGALQVRGFAEGGLGRAKAYALSTAEVRIPLSNIFGKLPAQVREYVFFCVRERKRDRAEASRLSIVRSLAIL